MRALVLAGAIVSLACVRTRVAGSMATLEEGPSATANFLVDGTTYHISGCRSGDREYFLGADLADEAHGTVLRLLVDPLDGPRLRLTRPAPSAPKHVTFTRDDCRELHASVEPTGWRVNRVRDVRGHLEADCTSRVGVAVVAHVRFSHCH